MSDWRDASPSKCERCGREWPTERLELVERLISAERRARVAEATLRERMNEPSDRSLVLLQQARIDELEQTVVRLNETVRKLNQRKTA